MNLCRETVKMDVPPGNRRGLNPRRTWTVRRRGSLSWACRRNTRGRQASGSESLQLGEKDVHIIRARSAPLSPASGFPVSQSEQPIHE